MGKACQYSSHQERERQLEGVLKQTLSTGSLSTSGRHQVSFQPLSGHLRDVSHGPSDQTPSVDLRGNTRRHLVSFPPLTQGTVQRPYPSRL